MAETTSPFGGRTTPGVNPNNTPPAPSTSPGLQKAPGPQIPGEPVETNGDDIEDLASLMSDEEEKEEEVVDTSDRDEDDTEESDLSDLEEVEESGRRSGYDLTWGNVENIWNFGVRFSKASSEYRVLFQNVTECYGDVISIARDLLTPSYRLSSIATLVGVIEAKAKGDMMYMFDLGTKVGAMQADEMRALVRVSNLISEEFAIDGSEPTVINYRRNMDSGDVAKTIMQSMWAVSDEASKFLDWAQGLLHVWPSGVVSVD